MSAASATTEARLEFAACDTSWRVVARGPRAARAARAAHDVVRALERRLNAFDAGSAVARLNREGRVEDAHVAALARRAEEYRARTCGAFDVARGELEREIKAYVRGATSARPSSARRARYHVRGDVVVADGPLDLNGLAKGYIVDRAQEALEAAGAVGFVDGGGDIARPIGPVGVDEGGRRLGVLDTRWNVATSGNGKRRRDAVDHLYDARDGRVGARHAQVTVVAARDTVEADALATTLAVLPLEDGLRLIEGWPGAEALWSSAGRLYASSGFGDHVLQA